MIRNFRLTNEPGGLGLSCTSAGVSLARVPLLRKTGAGFAPRPADEIAALLEAAYGEDRTRLRSSLGVIAEALNAGDLARAAIAAVQSHVPELSLDAARRLAQADQSLPKYVGEPAYLHELRDWRGRWTTGGGEISPVAMETAEDKAADEKSRAQAALRQDFESKYDELGPTEFAKEAIQFGDWLGREGRNFSQEEKDHARAEYAFLQNQLSFWLDYDYKPPQSQAHLLAAALSLFHGAINGKIVEGLALPHSMLYVAGAAAFDNGPQAARPRIVRPSGEPPDEPPPKAPFEPTEEITGVAGLADREELGTVWRNAIGAQGLPWEDYLVQTLRGAWRKLIPDNHKAFDLFNDATGEAISAKTLDTMRAGYIKDPREIYRKLQTYVKAMANYKPRLKTELDPEKIRSKTMHLAVPEYTSPAQWRELRRARRYAKELGVSMIITRVRE